MKGAGTYEATCEHCGRVINIIAEDQQHADVMATQDCPCGAEKIKRKKMAAIATLKKNIDTVCGPDSIKRGFAAIDEEIIRHLKAISDHIDEDKIWKLQIGLPDSTLQISATGDKIKIVRTRKEEFGLESPAQVESNDEEY